MGVKGQKSKRGVGDSYPETKSRRRVILITPTADRLLVEMAKTQNVSVSEAIERLVRSLGHDHTLPMTPIRS